MVDAKEIARGEHFRYQGQIWKVVRKEVISVGTHSHSKTKLITKNIFGGGEKPFVFAHSDQMDVLDIKRKTGSIISKSGNNLQLMDTMSYETLDTSCEEELASQIKEGDEVVFITIDNKTIILEKKNG